MMKAFLPYVNSPLGFLFRSALGISDRKHRIVKLTNNSCHVDLGNGNYQATLYINNQYQEAALKNLDWFMRGLHTFDMRVANPLRPAWNMGFDSYSSQPDDTTGLDAYVLNNTATTNYNTTVLSAGEDENNTNVFRSFINFNLSSMAGATVSAVTLSLWINADVSANARDFKLYRVIRNWVETEVTWNVYSTGNNWSTAGCGSDGNDADLTTPWATKNLTATEAIGTEEQFVLSAAGRTEFDKWLSGEYNTYGWLLKADTEANDRYVFDSSGSTTAGERPKLVATYSVGGGSGFFAFF